VVLIRRAALLGLADGSAGGAGNPTTHNVQFGDTFITYPYIGSWQFVRVVRTGGNVYVCLNGQRVAQLAVNPDLPSSFKTYHPPALGIEDSPSLSGAVFDGMFDDVRAITGALPCN